MTSGTLTCFATAYVSAGIQSDPFEPVGATNLLSPYFGNGLAIQWTNSPLTNATDGKPKNLLYRRPVWVEDDPGVVSI